MRIGRFSSGRRKPVRDESREAWSQYRTPKRFRFEVLGNAVFEGTQSLQDILDAADEIFKTESMAATGAIAADALERLLAEHLVTSDHANDADEAKTREEMHRRALRALKSRNPDERARISMSATQAGVALAEDPPDEIRRLWRLPPRVP